MINMLAAHKTLPILLPKSEALKFHGLIRKFYSLLICSDLDKLLRNVTFSN